MKIRQKECMGKLASCPSTISEGSYIIDQAKEVNLDPGVLYETVIDLASEGLITSTAINMAAGILVTELALPNYFFENITKESLRHILSSIALSIKCQDGCVGLSGRVAHIDFNLEQGSNIQAGPHCHRRDKGHHGRVPGPLSFRQTAGVLLFS